MPQMKPSMWLIILMWTTLSLMSTKIMLFFLPTKMTPKVEKQEKQTTKMEWQPHYSQDSTQLQERVFIPSEQFSL